MVSVNFKLAILTVLAKWPDRRATIDEIRQEVGIIFANGDQTDLLKRLSALGDIDIFQTGLVSRNEDGFQITDAGLSLVRSLESSGSPSPGVSVAPTSKPFRLIDDLIGTEERLKIFDLELRTLDNIAFDGNDDNDRQPGQVEANWVSEIEAPADAPQIGAGGLPESIDPETYEGNQATAIEALGDASLMGANGLPESFDPETYDVVLSEDEDQPVQSDEYHPVSIDVPSVASSDVPAFLPRSFGSRGQDSGRKSLQLASLLAFIAEKCRFIAGAWRPADGPVRWKFNLAVPFGWKRSVGRLSSPYFHHLRIGVVSAAVVVAALFSMPHRPQKPEKPEQPMAVAVTPPPPAPSFNTLPPGTRTLFDPNPSPTLRHSEPDAIPAPETPSPPAQIDVRRVLKFMNAGVAKYASEQDEANKVKGAKLIQIAALLGYQTARNLVVVNYPRAASVRAAVAAPDVILYAMDLFQAKQAEAASEFVTLANYFSARGEIVKFAKVVVDVVRDDSRLSDAEQVDSLFKALSRIRGVCSAIKQLVLGDPAIGENDCSDTVQAGLLAQAKGSNGLEKQARVRGIELMGRTDAAP